MPGYDLQVLNSEGDEVRRGETGTLAIRLPLPPSCLPTLWNNDARFRSSYLSEFKGYYTTSDAGYIDQDGYVFVMARTDDVINVAGHRLGTREIEESLSSHPNIAEVAVVGVADQLKGQVAMAFAILKDPSLADTPEKKLAHEGEMMKTVDSQLGAVARPARVHFVSVLPKTRSGKLLRRSIQALCEGRDPGDLTTIEDPTALEQIRGAVRA
jgi:propionyl-CoA synthetase